MEGREIEPVSVLIVILIALAGTVIYLGGSSDGGVPYRENIVSFSSTEDLERYLNSSLLNTRLFDHIGGFGPRVFPGQVVWRNTPSVNFGAEAKSFAIDYSGTNVQVKNVGEADIVKSDGKFIYAVSKDEVFIVDAYPFGDMEVVSRIETEGNIYGMYLEGNRLVIIGRKDFSEKDLHRSSESYVLIYDISEKSDPDMISTISVDGRYFDSRKIGNHAYLISIFPVREENVILPQITYNGNTENIPPSHIHRFEGEHFQHDFTNIIALDIDKGEIESRESYLTGRAQNLYVSTGNIYIVGSKYFGAEIWRQAVEEVLLEALPTDLTDELKNIWSSKLGASEKIHRVGTAINNYFEKISESQRKELIERVRGEMDELEDKIEIKEEKTKIHKISIEAGNIDYMTNGEVPGRVLNQFSMSEYEDHFRIATTTGHIARTAETATAKNHVYILDDNLNIVGRLENLAPNEDIYSARFMGERCYLVTFRKVDPLFALDLSNPSDPKVLGRLKIPGYSNYLHPYGDGHLIGIGKSTVASEQGDFSWYQGVKIALFDVNDVDNLKEISKIVIGDRGTESIALREHHAFLFDKSRNLLSIPITVAEIDEEEYNSEIPPNTRGEITWQGAYVFRISPQNGISIQGRISHFEDDEFEKDDRYYGSPLFVKRALYIENILYTYSESKLKANSLKDLNLLGEINLD